MPDPVAAPGLAERALAARTAASPYLTVLNPEQREAVEALDGPVLVLAGAGTGKTRVLTTRIAHILASGRARPSEILAVTFTNKASREMKERVAHLVGHAVEGMPWLGTFHATGVKVLRRHAELVGLKPDFTILDTDDQIRLLKQLLQADNVDEKRWPARLLATYIDGWKNRALTPEQVPAGEGAAFANGRGQSYYAAYQARLKTLNAVDFGDLLLEMIRLFREHPDVLKSYQERFKYILVDEYQDTNVAQYLWLRLIAQGRRNVCCVGDDDQSIYGWRGAEVDNILRFETDFPGAKVIRLERNYRSTGHILATAAHLIAHNQGRLGKTLFTDDEDGDKPSLTSTWDSEEEARAIGEEIEQGQRRGQNLNEMAILVRASFQMREFEDRFVTIGLPYRVIGGPRFYERAEIRDALAYLRCVAQGADDLAFERIVNVPKRGLGDATVKLVHDYARAENMPMMQAARFLTETEEIKPKARNSLRGLLDQFDRWRGSLDSLPHTELAELILEESGYTDMWQKEKSADSAGRLENLKELVRSMQDFENLQGFLEHIALVADKQSSENAEAVSIMTLHSAKGLEFETVFLPGWEEGLFPHQRALDEQGRAGLEEERRLAYVGITRARRNARIYFASNRRIHGLWQSSVPSRFINELPQDHVEIAESAAGFGGSGVRSRFDEPSNYSTPGWQRAKEQRSLHEAQARFTGRSGSQAFGASYAEGRGGAGRSGFMGRMDEPKGGGRIINASAREVPSGPSRYAVGDRVFHQKFGYGDVLEADGGKLTVQFDKAGEKKVMESFVEDA